MKRKELEKSLIQFGYSKNTVDKFFQLRLKPTADKMFKLEDEFGIPVHAWRDIKSYLQENNTKQNGTTTRTQGQSNGN